MVGEAHDFRLPDVIVFPNLPDELFGDPLHVVVFVVIQFHFDV